MSKEIEAFESWIKKEYPEMLELISHSDVKQAYDFSWEVWQAAKAQAVPEGFILVPKKLPDELNDHLWDFMTDNFVCTNDYGDSFMACDDFNLDKFYAELIEAMVSNCEP